MHELLPSPLPPARLPQAAFGDLATVCADLEHAARLLMAHRSNSFVATLARRDHRRAALRLRAMADNTGLASGREVVA